MGDRSWNYNNSHGDRRGGNPRPRYVSRNASYYVNHGPPGRYRPPEPRQHHQSYNYSGPPRNYLNHETEPRIVRTVINSSYQPPPPHRYSRDSRDFHSADSRHHDGSGSSMSRQHEASVASVSRQHDASGPPVPRNWSSSSSTSRQRNESPNDRFHGNSSRSPLRSHVRRSPSNPRSPTRYMNRSPSNPRSPTRYMNRSPSNPRSPTRYINRSPPRSVSRSSPNSRIRSSPHRSSSPSLSPRQRTGRRHNVSYHEEREKADKRSHSSSGARIDSLNELYTRRSRKESESDVDLSPEVLKLIERVMEYQAWLTGVKHNILATRRGKEREDEIEGIEWCLGVILDIKSSADVSIQTLNRAQEVILELVRKNAVPVNGGTSYDRGVGSPSVLPTDDSESARSPSPGFSSSVAKRREPDLLSPRVIPTERTAFRTAEFDFSYAQGKDKPRDTELIDYHSDYPNAQSRDKQRIGPLYERRKRPSVEVVEIPSEAPLFERRPKPPVILQDKDMRTSTLSSNPAQWEGNSNETRGCERPQKPQDQDMRLLGLEQPAMFNEYRSEHMAPEKSLSQTSDKTAQSVPSNSTDIASSSSVGGSGVQSNLSSLATAPLQPPPLPPQLPIPFLNQSMLNQFLNPSVIAGMSGIPGMNPQQIMAMQNQAQMVFGFQQQMSNPRPGLLPTPSVTNNISQNFAFQQSSKNVNSLGAQPSQAQSPTKPQPTMVERPSVNPSTNSEPTTEVMMSRIMAKAAQSFSNQGRGSSSRYGQSQPQYGRDRNGFNNNSNQGVARNPSNEMNQGHSSTPPEPSSTIMDPRLKPRVPREPIHLDVSETKSADVPISASASAESTSHNLNHLTISSRGAAPRDQSEQFDEKVGAPHNPEANTNRHNYASQRRKHEEEYRSLDTESRYKHYSDRRNSYGSSSRDRPYERSHYDRERGSERDGNTGRNSRGNGSPRRRVDDRSFVDRNTSKYHPAVLPFEKSVFKNSSEGGGSSTFKIPKKPVPSKPEDIPVPDIQQNSINLDEDWDADLEREQVRTADENTNSLKIAVQNSNEQVQSVEENSVVNAISSPVPAPDPSPADVVAEKLKPLPREADNLIRSLLLESLNPEEAEILETDEDYLASAIAKLKAELSEKLRAKAKQKSSDPEVEREETADPSTISAPSASQEEVSEDVEANEESEEEEKSDERSRSRPRKRTQPSRKRKSSLDKLQAALQEMNFDAIMPTGPRHCKATAKNQVDDKPNEKAKQNSKTRHSSESAVIVETLDSTQAGATEECMVRGKTKKRKAATWYAVKKKGRKATTPPAPKETPTDTDVEPAKKSKTVRTVKKIQPKKKRSGLVNQSNREGVVTRSRRSDTKVTDQKDVDTVTEPLERSTDIESIKPEECLNEEGLMELELDDLNAGLHDDELDFDMLLDEDATLPLHPEDFCIPDSDDENGFIISEDGLEGLTVAEPEKYPDLSTAEVANNESENMDTGVEGLQESDTNAELDAETEVVLSANECHRCSYTGKKLIHHYANSHPDVSIPQARLGQLTYESLLRLNASLSPQLMEIPIKKNAENQLVCACLYCQDVFHNLRQYVDHLTTHTGEYRYACNICGVRYPLKKTASNHLKCHKKEASRRVEEVYDLTISADGTEFYSYVCRECFYFQLHATHISTHLEEIGHSEEDVICVKFQIQESETTVLASVPVEPPAPDLVQARTYDPSVFLGIEQVILDDEIGTAARAVSPLTVMETREDGPESSIDQIYDRLFVKDSDSSVISEGSNISGETDSMILDEANRVMEQIMDRLSLPDELNATLATLCQNLQESVTNLCNGPKIMDLSPDSSVEANLENAGECTDDDEESEELNDFYYDTSSSDDDSCDSMEIQDFSESSLLMDIGTEEPCGTNGIEICSSSLQLELPRDITDNCIPSAPISLIDRDLKLGMETDGVNIKVDLEGIHLYRCAQEGCDYRAATGAQLKEHLPICGFLSDNQSNCCFHCEKRFKLPMSLIDHLKIHGKPKQVCSLCSFRCCAQGDLTKHMRCVHKVTGYKTIRSDKSIDSDVIMYPKDATNKFTDAQTLQQNHMLYSPRVEFLPTEIANIPNSCIFSSPLHCALCSYSTKVRTNIIRHLKLHEDAQNSGALYDVPSEAPVNPVPCLARQELMFDKMVNLAGSSYVVQSTSTRKEVEESSPRFVVDQFRYVCSVRNCKQITVDDSMLRAHMKALHSEVALYHCPHCHDNEKTRNDPRNAVPIEKLGLHLKLHGPRLLKCGHCPFIHFQTKVMEKHVAEKHFDRKPNHLVVRNLDDEGNVSNRRSSVDELQKNSDRWRCALCRSLFGSWNEVRQHCEDVHKVPGQFVCNVCRFSDDAIFQMSKHISSGECVKNSSRIPYVMIMFARNEAGNQDETSVHNIWRRDTTRVKHIRGIFLEESAEPGYDPRKSTSTVLTQKTTATSSSASSPNKKKVMKAIPASPKSLITSAAKFPMVCPKCKTYKTTNKKDMTVHLHNELRYQRYVCKLCGLKNVTLTSLKVHVENDHMETYIAENFLILKPKLRKIEKEVRDTLNFLEKEMLLKADQNHKPVVVPSKKSTTPTKKKFMSAVHTAMGSPSKLMANKVLKPAVSPVKNLHVPLLPRSPSDSDVEIIEISDDEDYVVEQPVKAPVKTYLKHQVARKSTSRGPMVLSRKSHQPVARKRVTQVPRNSLIPSTATIPYSFYRKKLSPIDIHAVRLLTNVGEACTSVSVANLHALLDLSPFVPLADVMTD